VARDDEFSDDYERAAAGQDFDESIHERASALGARLSEGPEALLDEIEALLPETWRDQIQQFPISAVILGVAVGVFLGYKKGDEIIEAGSAMLTATATSNINSVFSGLKS
jgi:hypothetical protein